MTKISITVYKDSGKFYADGAACHAEDLPLWSEEFKKLVRENLPARYGMGYVVVQDLPGGEGFHNALYRFSDLEG